MENHIGKVEFYSNNISIDTWESSVYDKKHSEKKKVGSSDEGEI